MVCFFSLFFLTLQFNVKLLSSCPSGNKFRDGETLSSCDITGPRDSSFVSIGGSSSITIEKSKFRLFTANILDLSPSGFILLSGLLFDSFTGSPPTTAISVAQATEFMMKLVSFTNFSNSILVEEKFLSQAVGMWTLFDVTCTTIAAYAGARGLFSIYSDSFYADVLTCVDCTCLSLLYFQTAFSTSSPVLRGLRLTRFNLDSSGSVFQSQGGYFYIEGAEIIDTNISFAQANPPLYFESTTFADTGTQTRTAVDANGALSVVNCTFEGFAMAIQMTKTISPFLVCGSTFTHCLTCVNSRMMDIQIIHSIFRNYTTALVLFDGEVFNCAFISGTTGLAIDCTGSKLSLGNVCFQQATPIIRMASGTIDFGEGCCFQSSLVDAISGTHSTSGNLPQTPCSTQCETIVVSSDRSVCGGYKIPPVPTPRPARTHVINIPTATFTAELKFVSRKWVIVHISSLGFFLFL
jgi:hypothetical protein